MKRIYLFITLLAAILMTGCSDNDDVIIDPNPVDGEEMIYFSIGVSDGITTKAGEEVVGNEDKIYNLTALLFYSVEEDGKTAGDYAYGKTVTDVEGGLDFIGDLEVTPNTYDIILIANSGINYTEDKPSLSELNNKVDDVLTQSSSNMLMVSDLYKGVTLAYKLKEDGLYERNTYCYMLNDKSVTSDFNSKQQPENVYKDDDSESVLLTRLASRIQLESITLDFTENLDGASFRLQEVYLVNARPTTLLIPNDGGYEAKPGGIKYYRGAPDEVETLYGMIAPDIFNEKAVSEVKTEIYQEYGDDYIIKDGNQFSFLKDDNIFRKYAFENHKVYDYKEEVDEDKYYDTRLVISGVITLKGGQVLDKCYYHIPIKGDDIALERNNIYAINVTLTSYGYNRPDGSITIDPKTGDELVVPESPESNAKFDVSITVKPWNVINQYEEDPVLPN